MKHLRLLPAIFFVSLTWTFAYASPASAEAAETAAPDTGPVIWLLDGEALFGYSDIVGGTDGDFSTSEKWLASAALKVNEKDQLIGLYNGSFRKDNIFIRQDDGTQQSNQLLSHNLSAAYKKFFGEDFVFKPVFFYNLVYIKETADEDLGDGLYDYEDLGGGFENTHLLKSPEGKVRKLTYGFSVFRREYPNYRTLEALASRQPLEDREKDFMGYKADAGYRTEWWWDTTARVYGTVLFKDYTDKLTVDSNGIRESDERRDLYTEIGGQVSKPLAENLHAAFASGFRHNSSTLDFYDTRNTLTLADDRFFDGYFDYHAYDLSPSLTVTGPKFAEKAENASLQIGYAFEKTFYPGRATQDPAGALLSEDQEDRNHKITGRLVVPFTEQWSWLLAASYEKQTSNQKFEQTFLYSYESWSVLSGIRFEA